MRDYEADLWNTGLFKVANGEDITKAEKPGMFDLKVDTPFPHIPGSCTHPELLLLPPSLPLLCF